MSSGQLQSQPSAQFLYATHPIDDSSAQSEVLTDGTWSPHDTTLLVSMFQLQSDSLAELHKKVDLIIAALPNLTTSAAVEDMTLTMTPEEAFQPVNTLEEITALNEKLKSDPEFYSELVSILEYGYSSQEKELF